MDAPACSRGLRLLGFAALPLALLAQGAGTKLLARRAAQRAIWLEGNILPREAARFPGESHDCPPVSLNRNLRVVLLVRQWESRSKLGGAHRIRMKLLAQFQEPRSGSHWLMMCHARLSHSRMADPAVGVLFLVAGQPELFQTRHDADTAPRHRWR